MFLKTSQVWQIFIEKIEKILRGLFFHYICDSIHINADVNLIFETTVLQNYKQNNCYMVNDKSADVRTLLVEEKARWTAKSSPLDKLSSGQKMQMLGAVPPEPPPTAKAVN
jgi:hypothetical protein